MGCELSVKGVYPMEGRKISFVVLAMAGLLTACGDVYKRQILSLLRNIRLMSVVDGEIVSRITNYQNLFNYVST